MAHLLPLLLLLCLSFNAHAQETWRPGEVLILLRKDAKAEDVRLALQQRLPSAIALKAMTVLGPDSRYHLVQVDGTSIDEPALEKLLARAPGVEATSLNYIMELRVQPNDELYPTQWSMAAIGVEQVWNTTTGGSMANGNRIAVGIVDGLVQTTHPDLADNISQASTYAGEGEEHGTMVAGVVGATGNNGIGVTGVNWDVDLVPLGFGGDMAGAISGFEGALSLREDFTNSAGAEGALVVAVTVSWGFLGISCGFGYAVFEDMGNAGILAITAAPNDPVDTDEIPDFPSGCPNSNNIAVTAIGPDGENPFAVGNSTIHLQAPGIAIPTTAVNGGYEVTDGTSFSVPHVTGAVALLYSVPCPSFAHLVMTNPSAAAQLVKNAILQGGTPVPGGNDITITGRTLNVLGAYEILMDQCVQTCTDLTITFTPTEGVVAEALLTGPLGNTLATTNGPVVQGCLEAGCYQATFSAAGGAPVGGTWSVMDGEANVVASGASTDGQLAFSFGTIVPGCTTPNSGNFDPAANCNDGSCCPGEILRVKVLAEDLVSEGTAQVTITAGGSVVFDGPVVIVSGSDPEFGVEYAVGTVEVCAPDGCMSIAVTSGSIPLYEVGFLYIGNDDPIPFQTAAGHIGAVGNAGGPEVCDGQDNDCDGEIDEDFRWYADADGDGFGDPTTLQISCSPIPGAVQDGNDCNDDDPAITTAGTACDDGDPTTLNDVIRSNCQCLGFNQGNCPPGEILDCNGNCAPADWMGDGLCNDGSIEWEGNLIVFICPELNNDGGDCFDPCGPEICDGADNDCDGEVDEDHTWYMDADDDGFGDDATATISCLPPLDAVQVGGDCDDGNDTVNPGAAEACDNMDNDCDGSVDEDFIWYVDADGDGLGDDATEQFSCTPLPDMVHVGGDCDDNDAGIAGVGAACDDGNPATVNDIVRTNCQCLGFNQGSCPPGEIEDCNGNCAPTFWLADGFCDDGSFEWEGNFIFLNCPELSNDMGDCSSPCPPEVCDGTDNDCDGEVDEGCAVALVVRVHLGGPYDPDTGLMGDGMRALGLVPTTEPYTGLGYAHTGGGGETTTAPVLAASGHDAIVDWVVIELRDALDPAVIVASRCALLQRDGDAVEVDGQSSLAFAAPSGNYFVAVRHRNHLPAMTLTSVALSNGPTTVDLTIPATLTYGTEARVSVAGTFATLALWAGDINFDTQVMYTGGDNDRDPILQRIGGTVPTNIAGGYLPEDVDLNGQVLYTGNGNDRDPILSTIGGTVPTNVRHGQLP